MEELAKQENALLEVRHLMLPPEDRPPPKLRQLPPPEDRPPSPPGLGGPKPPGQPPQTGGYKQLKEQERIRLNLPRQPDRVKRAGMHLGKPPIFGGIILSGEVKNAPEITNACFVVAKDKVRIVVKIKGEKEEFEFTDLTMTELWCAYQFLHPGKELRDIGAEKGEVGLVGKTGNVSGDGRIGWKFGIHPAIADTPLARESMRLDMVLAANPFLAQYLQFTTYQWYGEAADIEAKDGRIFVAPASGPQQVLMRVRLWGYTKSAAWYWKIKPEDRDRVCLKRIEQCFVEQAKRKNFDNFAAYDLWRWRLKFDRFAEEAEREVREAVEWTIPLKWYQSAATRKEVLHLRIEQTLRKKVQASDIPTEASAVFFAADEATRKSERSSTKTLELFDQLTTARRLSRSYQCELYRELLQGMALREMVTLKVRQEGKQQPKPEWLANAPNEEAAERQEIALRYAEKKKDAGLNESTMLAVLEHWVGAREQVDTEIFEEGPIKGDTTSAVEELFDRFDALRRFAHFARVVAVLSWLERDEKLPDLPADVKPVKINVPAELLMKDVMP